MIFSPIFTLFSGHLKDHYGNTKCNNENGNSLRNFVQKRKVNFTQGDKQLMVDATVNYCAIDKRSFYSIRGAGLRNLLHKTATMGSKYGLLSEEAFNDLMPAPNTV